MSGTELAYGATRCTVLKKGMLLRDVRRQPQGKPSSRIGSYPTLLRPSYGHMLRTYAHNMAIYVYAMRLRSSY
eukprot:2015277-Rhodomonas_salina.1